MTRKEKALEFIDEGYNIQITGRHIEVTNSMKDYAMEKISKIEKLRNRITDINVIMDIQKYEHRAEIILKVDHIRITSRASSDDMYASIDKAVNKIESQLRRYKTKVQNHQAPSLADIDVNVQTRLPQDDEEEFDEFEALSSPNTFQPQITEEKKLDLKLLTYKEAMAKLDVSHELFLVFKHEEDENQKLKIMYHLENGNYGVIEPKC
jgi:putative sigma-54 modulation protein